ncbi:MAG: YfhD family protein [Paenisporosarcina sp.]
MGKDNHNSSSNNKNSLPQTPKALKTPPSNVKDEFSRELTDIINNALKKEGTSSKQSNKSKK